MAFACCLRFTFPSLLRNRNLPRSVSCWKSRLYFYSYSSSQYGGLQLAGVANSVSSSWTSQKTQFIGNKKKRNRFDANKQKAMQDDLERLARLGGFGLILVISKPNSVQCEVIASSTAADIILEQGGAFLDPSAPVSRLSPGDSRGSSIVHFTGACERMSCIHIGSAANSFSGPVRNIKAVHTQRQI